jgi:hypothetical protein
VNEFVGECRREWRRLGVPDPIANEMAADLTADIEEAEAEGGSAEDVLGNSLFDPRRFAAAWAGARGVTGPSTHDRLPRRWPVLAIALTVFTALITMAAAALLVGRHSVAVAAAPVRRILTGPESTHLFGPGPVTPPFRLFVHGPPFDLQNIQGFGILALVLLLIGVVGLGLAVRYWSPWLRRRLHATTRITGRTKWPEGSSR